MDDYKLRQAVEAVLFASSEVKSSTDIAQELGCGIDPFTVRRMIKQLNLTYVQGRHAFRIKAVGSGFQLQTMPELSKWIKKPPSFISRAQLETLAIIAYSQPITRHEIEFLRGVDASYSIKKLMGMKLIRVKERKAEPGRPLLYGTTSHFLHIFGLKSLAELPHRGHELLKNVSN